MVLLRKISAEGNGSYGEAVSLRDLLGEIRANITLDQVNARIEELANISSFFASPSELAAFRHSLVSGADASLVGEDCGRQWGDFQTPLPLAMEVCSFLYSAGCRPRIIIEPTSGEGTFIKAATKCFPGFRHMYGVEIQPSYVSESKLSLLKQALAQGPFSGQVSIDHADIFMHKFPNWLLENTADELLILGNPPWVTNAELATLDSTNLPVKENFKGHSGMDAMTGKSNFDISEYIILKILETFGNHNGYLALLCKNSVIRNLVQALPRRKFKVADIKAFGIDAKKHFNAAVDASLFVLRLGAVTPESKCGVFDSISSEPATSTFGWSGDKFVSNIDRYEQWRDLDGESPYVWRQGLKHDCSKVMELTGSQGTYENGLGETVQLEPESVFPFLKSSDLKGFAARSARFVVPVTQRKIGEDTSWIEQQHPKLSAYLEGHQALFDARKSSIYRGKPRYSIFGIGDYSFVPYKVAISGMYKTGSFSLVEPINGQSVMLDDTCYFLGFDSYKEALLVCSALNSAVVQGLLKSVVFLDAKRPYTKDLLMRIDLRNAFQQLTFKDITDVWATFRYEPTSDCSEADFNEFVQRLTGFGIDGKQLNFLV